MGRENVLENTFEKSKNQNPSKSGWVLKKIWVLWVGVVEFKKTMFFKTEFSSPLKTIFFYILQVSDSWTSHDPTRKMCRCKGQIFTGQVWVANHLLGTHETLCLKFLRNWNFLKISRLEAICKGRHKMAKHKVF